MVACLLVAMDRSPDNNKPELVGRCFDLKSAYKQFGVDEYHAEHLKIALKKPRGEVAFYDVLALPFGATGSVSAFLRLAASIAFIGVAGLGLTWTVFFDDLTCVSSEKMKDNTSFYAESLFRLLGMCFAEEGPKAPPFASTFKTLGLQLDISEWRDDVFTLEHTVARRKELEETMSEMLQVRNLTHKQLERLHGRLVWFNSYIFGRSINKAVRVISKHARQSEGSVKVGEELAWALHRLLEVVTNAQLLKISKCLSLTWVVFTDGAYEPSSDTPATIGGLIVHPQGKVVGFFGEELPKTLTDQFTSESNHPIYELELFPVLISLALWSQHIGGAHVVCYLDNDAARSSLIRGAGATNLGQWLVDLIVELEQSAETVPWFARVPTSSNPADKFYRLIHGNHSCPQDEPHFPKCSKKKVRRQ